MRVLEALEFQYMVLNDGECNKGGMMDVKSYTETYDDDLSAAMSRIFKLVKVKPFATNLNYAFTLTDLFPKNSGWIMYTTTGNGSGCIVRIENLSDEITPIKIESNEPLPRTICIAFLMWLDWRESN